MDNKLESMLIVSRLARRILRLLAIVWLCVLGLLFVFDTAIRFGVVLPFSTQAVMMTSLFALFALFVIKESHKL